MGVISWDSSKEWENCSSSKYVQRKNVKKNLAPFLAVLFCWTCSWHHLLWLWKRGQSNKGSFSFNSVSWWRGCTSWQSQCQSPFLSVCCMKLILQDHSVLWHWWLGDRKFMRPVKKLGIGLLIVMIWLNFLCLIGPVVTTTSITLSSNKIQNGYILVLANPGPPGKRPLKRRVSVPDCCKRSWCVEPSFSWLSSASLTVSSPV